MVPFVRLPTLDLGGSRTEDVLRRFTMTLDRAARQLRLERAK